MMSRATLPRDLLDAARLRNTSWSSTLLVVVFNVVPRREEREKNNKTAITPFEFAACREFLESSEEGVILILLKVALHV